MTAGVLLLRRAEPALIPAINLTAALVLSALVVLATGADPIEAMIVLARGAAGDGASLGYTLYYTTNFILAGLAVALPFHAGIFNIGGEGQAYMGGLLASLVCLFAGPALGWAAIPLAVLAAAAGGALWALAPAWLFVTRGSHVVITTIMFNFIASAVMTFLLISADLDEIRLLADRILVICGGRIAGEVSAEAADERGLSLLMAGAEAA